MINSVNIMGREIKIKQLSSKEIKEAKARGDVDSPESEELKAWYNPFEQTIFISKELSTESFNRILLHELTHACFAIGGLTHLLTGKQEEAICDMAENFLDLFKNKEFMQMLSSKG